MGCGDDKQDPPISVTFEVVSAALVPMQPKPGEAVVARVILKNTSATTWKSGAVTLSELEPSGFALPALALVAAAAPGAEATFEGALSAPEREGRFTFVLRPKVGDEAVGATVRFKAETSCSNGVFCDGIERYVDSACKAGFAPCDDAQACTTDICDEAKDSCGHTLGADCAACFSDCEPDCAGKACGADGCGGSCGDCAPGAGCSALNTCSETSTPGSCQSPLPLVANGTALAGDFVIEGDTSGGVNQVVPTCNRTSASVELVYAFTVTETVGFEAQSSGFDTVLHLRTSCLDDAPAATLRCSDDSAPPGDYGSRVSGKLVPGTYFLVIDGFDSSQFGAFQLRVRFVPGGCVPNCDGQSCGGDDGCGNSCGTCDDGEVCRATRCYPDPCTPSCERRNCGDDGCGGTCGTCADGKLCVDALGTCEPFTRCNGDLPVCDPPCGAGKYCGTDCSCYDQAQKLPDLTMNVARLKDEVLFDEINITETSCSWAEQCVGGLGDRKLLRFSVEAINQGQGVFEPPAPDTRPDLFVYSACHGHYHFHGFASYSLLDRVTGKLVTGGQKFAYCMEDTAQYLRGPDVPCQKQYDCSAQGISPGWSDLYGNGLDCQWIDVTDVPPGTYELRVDLNPGRTFQELTYDNNSGSVEVVVP